MMRGTFNATECPLSPAPYPVAPVSHVLPMSFHLIRPKDVRSPAQSTVLEFDKSIARPSKLTGSLRRPLLQAKVVEIASNPFGRGGNPPYVFPLHYALTHVR